MQETPHPRTERSEKSSSSEAFDHNFRLDEDIDLEASVREVRARGLSVIVDGEIVPVSGGFSWTGLSEEEDEAVMGYAECDVEFTYEAMALETYYAAGIDPEAVAQALRDKFSSFGRFLDCEAVLAEAAAVEEEFESPKADAGNGEA